MGPSLPNGGWLGTDDGRPNKIRRDDMSKQELQDTIKEYLESKYRYDIGKALDRLEDAGFYDDPDDVKIEDFNAEVLNLVNMVLSMEHVPLDTNIGGTVKDMISTLMWDYAGLEFGDHGSIIYKP